MGEQCSLTTQIKPWDAENLKQWQGGDIVVFDPPYNHVEVMGEQGTKEMRIEQLLSPDANIAMGVSCWP